MRPPGIKTSGEGKGKIWTVVAAVLREPNVELSKRYDVDTSCPLVECYAGFGKGLEDVASLPCIEEA